MENLPELIKQFASSAGGISLLAAALPVIFALLVQSYSRFAAGRKERVFTINTALAFTPRGAEPDWEADTRLSEARSALRSQETSLAWNRRTMNALTFSQYVIGGVLASSFVQTQLSKEVVGFLGVLVLVSSLIRQRYRPDIKHRNGKQRSAQLRAVIRKAEDAIFEARTQKKDASAISPIRQAISEGLNQLEAAELNDLQDSHNGET
jgi:hypothetical protein